MEWYGLFVAKMRIVLWEPYSSEVFQSLDIQGFKNNSKENTLLSTLTSQAANGSTRAIGRAEERLSG